ncbi:hypothetical protein [Ferrovibrio terrae]|uniref:hypothetical protein n=1 Tax=Ferrovibrio terrae TaxID=2594003 RepID=UPI003137FCE9
MNIQSILNSPITLLIIRLAVAAAAGNEAARKRIALVELLVKEQRDATPAEEAELFDAMHEKSDEIQSL